MNKRTIYLILSLILFLSEVLIALFIHDTIIRPYVGDIIVCVLLYCLIRIFLTEKVKLLPVYIFIFAVAVEILQYFKFVEIIGLGDIPFFRIIMGTSYSNIDIVCYAIGCAIVGIEIIKYKSNHKNGVKSENKKSHNQ